MGYLLHIRKETKMAGFPLLVLSSDSQPVGCDPFGDLSDPFTRVTYQLFTLWFITAATLNYKVSRKIVLWLEVTTA